MDIVMILILIIYLIFSFRLVNNYIARSKDNEYVDESTYIKIISILNCKSIAIMQVFACFVIFLGDSSFAKCDMITMKSVVWIVYCYVICMIFMSLNQTRIIFALEYKHYVMISRINNALKSVWLLSSGLSLGESYVSRFLTTTGYIILILVILKYSLTLWKLTRQKHLVNTSAMSITDENPVKRYTYLRFIILWVMPICCLNASAASLATLYFIYLNHQKVISGYIVLFIGVLLDELFYAILSKRLKETITFHDTYDEYYNKMKTNNCILM